MAKYTIKMSCGHEQEVSLFGKSTERERKIHYFETQGLCKECYKKKMDEMSEAQPFTYNIGILPYINEENGEILLFAWFEGNVKPHKEQIKELGYKWQQKEKSENLFGLMYSNEMCWGKTFDAKDLEEEIKRSKSIGIENVISIKDLLSEIAGSHAMKLHNEWEKNNSEVLKLCKPEKPELINGFSWNYKVYGRSGQHCIYRDGDKIAITDEQANELEAYLTAMKEYKKDIELIKSGEYELTKKKEKELEERVKAIEKPHVPEVLKGHIWNQKIYGKKGSYTVYPDSVKTKISDEEAEEIRQYLEKKEEYKKRIEEIKNEI